MGSYYTKGSLQDSTSVMMELLYKISPLQRMINSKGLDESCNILQEYYKDLVIHEYPCGSHAEDWEVPPAWEANFGELRDSKGNLLSSFEEHPLFVASYSEDVDGYFYKDEIEKHLRVNERLPHAYSLEHKNAFNYKLNTWGISLPYNLWQSMDENEKYHIKIQTEKNHDSTMKVIEWVLPGESSEIINIQAHIDELCNDDLSGCVVALEVMKHLSKIENRKYTYQMLLFPEMVGAFFYTYNNQDILKQTIGVLNLETLGDGEKFCLKKALHPGSLVEKALYQSFVCLDMPLHLVDFFIGWGNDERVYAFPTINIDGVSIQKFPYEAYHSSDDTPENISTDDLATGLSLSLKFCKILEENYIPKFTTLNPPWLTKHDLYFDRESDNENFHKYNNDLLFNINGKNSILDLCEITGISFDNICYYLDQFIEKKFIEKL